MFQDVERADLGWKLLNFISTNLEYSNFGQFEEALGVAMIKEMNIV